MMNKVFLFDKTTYQNCMNFIPVRVQISRFAIPQLKQFAKSNTDVETSFHFAYILQFLQCLLYFKANAHKSTLVNHFIIFDADFTPNI